MSQCPECDQPRLHDAFYQRWICQTPECPAPGWTYATPPNTTKEPTMTNLEQLAQIIAAHTRAPIRCYPPKCLCGETVETTQANHQAQAILDAGWTAPVEPVPFDADCWTCAKEIADKHRAKGDFATSLSFRMYLCPNCGNKRCPKATNHRAKCTGSNEPNQVPYLDN